MSIILDRDLHFTLRFRKQFHEYLGKRLNFSIAFHPQSGDQFERVIQVLEDMLRAYIIDFEVNWKCYLPLIEFVYNNNFQTSM